MLSEYLSDMEVEQANKRHDAQSHLVTFDPGARLRSSWKDQILGAPLTDRKIQQYENRGFYSAEFRMARKEYQQKKRRERRAGNFDLIDGRLIYRPL